jgi:acid phosphatase (class A)
MRLKRSALLLFFVWALPAYAAPYFDPASIDPALLTPPPELHGQIWDVEIEHIIGLQKSPDKEALEQAAAERNVKPELIAEAVDPALTRKAYPKLYHLLDHIGETTHPISDAAKEFWHTDRPYKADSRVKALIEPHDNASYPSGHTVASYTWAMVLGELMPEKRNAFIARARTIAEHRVLVGMHYPHDLAGGRELARLIMGGLLQNAEFRNDFAEAKKELLAGNIRP